MILSIYFDLVNKILHILNTYFYDLYFLRNIEKNPFASFRVEKYKPPALFLSFWFSIFCFYWRQLTQQGVEIKISHGLISSLADIVILYQSRIRFCLTEKWLWFYESNIHIWHYEVIYELVISYLWRTIHQCHEWMFRFIFFQLFVNSSLLPSASYWVVTFPQSQLKYLTIENCYRAAL